MGSEAAIDLRQFHPLPAQFHLAVGAAQDLQFPVVGPASQVAGLVEPARGRIDKARRREVGTIQIPRGQSQATQPHNSHRTGRDGFAFAVAGCGRSCSRAACPR